MIDEGEFWSNIAYFAFVKFRVLPHVLLSMPENELAFIVAVIKVYIRSEKQARKEAEQKAKAKK